MDREPRAGLNAQSNTARCGSLTCGAPSIVSFSSLYSMIFLICCCVYPSFFSAIGTVVLTIFIIPPPTSFLYFTSAMSGSTPVVSQSIMKPIVPVGAGTGAWSLGWANALPQRPPIVPQAVRDGVEIGRHVPRVDTAHRIAVFAHHPQERLAVLLVAG